MQELLDKRAEQPRKKSRVGAGAATDSDLPAVPEEHIDEDGDALPDDDMGQAAASDYQGPIRKASEKILAMHSSRATREYLHNKGQYGQAAGKGGKKGNTNAPSPPWGKGPTPAEAHGGPKRPGLQVPEGGEGGAGAAPPARAEPPPDAPDEPPRNQWGDGHFT